jgi:hypothetical protein
VPVCCQGCLAYLVVVASATLPHWGARIGTAEYLLLFSATFLFLCAFQLFFIPSNALLFILSSECSFSFVTLSLLIYGVKQRKLQSTILLCLLG